MTLALGIHTFNLDTTIHPLDPLRPHKWGRNQMPLERVGVDGVGSKWRSADFRLTLARAWHLSGLVVKWG